MTTLIWVALGLVAAYLFLVWLGRPRPWPDKRPEEVERVRAGHGLGIDELLRRLDLRERHLRELEPGYRTVSIPKRRGGTRTLHVPDPRAKRIQRRILDRLLGKLASHPAACGFERGRSIVHNALPHVGRAVVIRVDVEEFFPSTTDVRVDAYFRRIGWDADVAALLTKWTTHAGGLPQGAPTSPRLSNLVNYKLDVLLTAAAARRRGTYTRYADDITFSFPKDYGRKMRGIVQQTRSTLKVFGYRMHGRKKLSIRRRHQRQVVTGLVVNDKVQLPRRTRRWLRAVAHRHATGRGRPTLTEAQLAGWRSLQSMIESQR